MCKVYDLLSADISNIRHLPIKFIVEMIMYRLEDRREQKEWQKWVAWVVHMEKQVSFDEFKSTRNKTVQSNKTSEEIIQEIENIKRLHQNKGGDGE